LEDRGCADGEDAEGEVMPVWLRRLFGRGELRRGPCYPKWRPDRGAPFDEYDSEGRLHWLDRQEHIEMRRWAGRARA
jgi:hypothetical protein